MSWTPIHENWRANTNHADTRSVSDDAQTPNQDAAPPEDVRHKCVAIHAALIGHEPRIERNPLPPAPPTVKEKLCRDALRLKQLAFDLLGGFSATSKVRSDAGRRFEEAAARFAKRQKRVKSVRKAA
ncbi:MAG: hypothetical protein AAGD32_13365 [Planctomycetota bacterium]